MMKRLFLAVLTGLAVAVPAYGAADDMNAQTRAKAQQAIDAGLKFLKSKQAANGSIGNSVGLTALALRAILEDPRGVSAADKPAIERYAAFIVSKVNPDGSIVEIKHDESYNTAVAITALAATKDPKYAQVIANGQKYITKTQIGESRGFMPVDNWYGGLGYGGDERPDISNLYIALESLRATSLDPKDPVWQKALIFVNRMQNRSESNDQKYAGNDGGFLYSPAYNPPEYGGGTNRTERSPQPASSVCCMQASTSPTRACRPPTSGSLRTTRSTTTPARTPKAGSSIITRRFQRLRPPTGTRSSWMAAANGTTGATNLATG